MTVGARRHVVLAGSEGRLEVPPAIASAQGFSRRVVIDRAVSVHMNLAVCELQPGGRVPWHVHSFEESIYVLEGEVVSESGDGDVLLREGDYGVYAVGAPHAWRNDGNAPARWVQMLAPQQRSGDGADTFAVEAPVRAHGQVVAVDARDPRTRSFGHIDPGNMDVDRQKQEYLAMSASMRTALLVYSGITVKMMVDTDLGASQATMFMVQYEPGGFAGAHDHPFEEAFVILAGEVDTVLDGVPYRLTPGDVAFAGVGCTHQFTNPTDAPVRWLETQAPQPPARHSYRFARDWDYLADRLTSRKDDGG